MKQRKSWTQVLVKKVEQEGESVPLQPILELCGDRRIWIENHQGVREYSMERISVAVRFGQLVLCGEGLRLKKMQGNVLVVSGKIESITVRRGCV
jgi:sporulation protein YqfC